VTAATSRDGDGRLDTGPGTVPGDATGHDPGPPGASLSERWAGIGAGQTVGLLAVQLWLLELPFLETVRTARGDHHRRPLVLVHVVATAGGTLVEGWGECAALADTTFDAEDVTRAFALLEHALVPGLVDLAPRAGARLPRPSELAGLRQAAPDGTLAFAALEMAVADAHLRAEGRSFSEALGIEDRAVPVGAVVGQAESVDRLLNAISPRVDAGYRRIKMKIGPGWDREPIDAVSRAYPQLALQVDANGSYRLDQADLLAALDPYHLLCIEQPLAPDDLEGHALLAARLATPICLDESFDSPRSVRRALERSSCSVVCVKPARLGGVGAALEVIEQCTDEGVPIWMGGMFESGFARGVNAALATLSGFAWPGDLNPPEDYLGVSLVPPRPARWDPVAGGPVVDLPDGTGFGPSPDRPLLEVLSRRRAWFELPPG
jgi:O-succinylbenzoate synthase